MDFQKILDDAHAAAKLAQAGLTENPMALDCGFAWVIVDGNSSLARFCRKKIKEAGARLEGRAKKLAMQNAEQQYGSKGYPRGWQFWCPGEFHGQAVSIHEAGAKAFRDKLAEHGIRADVGSRLD